MVMTGELSNESTTNSGTGLVSFLNAMLSTESDEPLSFEDRSWKPDRRVSRRFDSDLDPNKPSQRTSGPRERIVDRAASLHLDREMCRTKRFQEIPRVKNFASSEHAGLLAPQVDDSFHGFPDDWRRGGVNILASCDCATFCIA